MDVHLFERNEFSNLSRFEILKTFDSHKITTNSNEKSRIISNILFANANFKSVVYFRIRPFWKIDYMGLEDIIVSSVYHDFKEIIIDSSHYHESEWGLTLEINE